MISGNPGNIGNPPNLTSGEAGNSGPPVILAPGNLGILEILPFWCPGNLGIMVLQIFGFRREHSGQEPFLEHVPRDMTSVFFEIRHALILLKNCCPGQTTILARFVSKNYVETRSQSPENSDMSPNPASKLQI